MMVHVLQELHKLGIQYILWVDIFISVWPQLTPALYRVYCCELQYVCIQFTIYYNIVQKYCCIHIHILHRIYVIIYIIILESS